MTKEEAKEILDRYAQWNEGQKSIDLALHGKRTAEDDVLDARRRLILKATQVLAEDDKEV
jgi:hypothetical protein